MDLISVIVPVYKVEQYLTRCVDSILNQTYKNIEIILVDDGSPDNCPSLCDKLCEEHQKIRVIHKANGGLSSARNAGINASLGSYISFIDSDDFVDEHFIERLYELISKYNADLAMLAYQEVSEKSVIHRVACEKEKVFRGKEIEQSFLQLKIDSVCVGLYSMHAIGDKRFIEGKTSEDIPFNFNMFRDIRTFVYAPERRYFYYYNTESISNGPLDKNMLNYLYFREDIYEFYKQGDKELEELAESLYARAAFGLLTRMALYGITIQLDEKKCRQEFTTVFNRHKDAFYKAKTVPLSRKVMAICTLHFYNIMKVFGRLIK